MFQYSGGGTGVPLVTTGESPQYETVRVSVQGRLPGVQAMLKLLYKLGYADPNDWGQPQPSQPEGEWITVSIRRIRID